MIDWGKAFQVAFVGFTGVFVGLILLKVCVNLLAQIVRVIERSPVPKATTAIAPAARLQPGEKG